MRPRHTLQLDSFAALVAHGHLEVAQRWLHRLAAQPPTQTHLEAWIHLLTSQPTAWRLHPQLAPWIGWLLIRAGQTDRLEPYLAPLSRQEPATQALWAQWWLWQNQPLPALEALAAAPPPPHPAGGAHPPPATPFSMPCGGAAVPRPCTPPAIPTLIQHSKWPSKT